MEFSPDSLHELKMKTSCNLCMMWNYALQIPKSLNQDRRSFKTTFTGAGISRSVALSYRKRCFCRFFKHCKSSCFCCCFTGYCISRNICFQASRSRFPTSYFQTGNQGLECAQNTKSLAWVSGWKKDAGDLHLVVI